MIRVLHVIRGYSKGGAATALYGLALRGNARGEEHLIVSLTPADEKSAKAAEHSGIKVYSAPTTPLLNELIESTSIVLVHWWNSPEMQCFFAAPMPACRLGIWFHVAGDKAPQVITRRIADLADLALACSPYTLNVLDNLNSHTAVGMVLAGSELEAFKHVEPSPHHGFAVGYVGTVDYLKMHPDFAAMSVAAGIPEARFIVCGDGDLESIRRDAEATGQPQRFEIRGWMDHVPEVMAGFDLYGYPLCRDTYAAAELNLQEAMSVGLPPVILPHGGAPLLVEHGVTGLIAQTPDEYSLSLARLHADSGLRQGLGENARRYALAHFGADNADKAMQRCYEQLLKTPKRTRDPLSLPPGGAARFVESLGNAEEPFVAAMAETKNPCEADQEIHGCSPLLASRWSGGILHYRDAYPDDPVLRFWAGLALLGQGRHSSAMKEFTLAESLGLPTTRLSAWKARAASGQPPWKI